MRGVPGVRSAQTTSLALGGMSVMRVVFDGDPARSRAALEARGWQVLGSGTTLRIRRAASCRRPTSRADNATRHGTTADDAMSQIALPLPGRPTRATTRSWSATSNARAVAHARTLGDLAGDGGDADRPAQIGPQPAGADLRGARAAAR